MKLSIEEEITQTLALMAEVEWEKQEKLSEKGSDTNDTEIQQIIEEKEKKKRKIKNDLTEYKKGKRERPQPKEKYFALLKSLEQSIADIDEEIELVHKTKKEKETKTRDDKDKFKTKFISNKTNIWAALAELTSRKLTESTWMVLEDAGLTNEELAIAKQYRQTLITLKTTHKTPKQAIQNFPDNPFPNLW